LTRKLRPPSPATLFFAFLSVLLGLLLYLETRPETEPPSGGPGVSRERPRRSQRARPAPPRSKRPSLSEPAARPRVAIVIDDLGNDLTAVERIARWPHPIAVAVLPELPASAPTARRLARSGKEVLLHLPMEPRDFPDVRPGPGVVLRSQSEAEIVRTLLSDLATVPGATGVNNHMGSAATADPRVMRTVLNTLAAKGLFFLDSRTTDSSVAREIAQQAAVPAVSRRVFLDGVTTAEGIERQWAQLLRLAREEGSAVAIGHPHPRTLDVLERELPRLSEQGLRLVRVSELVE
jgi:hypothetical protein